MAGAITAPLDTKSTWCFIQVSRRTRSLVELLPWQVHPGVTNHRVTLFIKRSVVPQANHVSHNFRLPVTSLVLTFQHATNDNHLGHHVKGQNLHMDSEQHASAPGCIEKLGPQGWLLGAGSSLLAVVPSWLLGAGLLVNLAR